MGESETIVSWLHKGARKTTEKTENDLQDQILLPETKALSLPMRVVVFEWFQKEITVSESDRKKSLGFTTSSPEHAQFDSRARLTVTITPK